MDLEQQTYQARVHARGEVYDILRLSNGVVVYSYTGGRLECSPQKLPNMDSDILCLEEYRWNNDDSNGNSSDLILILMGHRNGTVSLWDFSNRAPITAKLPSFVKHTGPVVAILCLPQSRAVLVQTALGGIHRYAIGRYQLVYEFPLKESASPGAVRGMAVDSSETVVWCPHLSETVELRLCSLATGEWIQSHILQDPFVRLELDPTCDGGYWIRAWNAQGSYRMISLHSERKKVIDE
jgi:WD40 repeat protein